MAAEVQQKTLSSPAAAVDELIAYPAIYGDSGVMTFVVNQDGIAYEKNLGPDTKRVASTIKSYDPDGTWQTSHEKH